MACLAVYWSGLLVKFSLPLPSLDIALGLPHRPAEVLNVAAERSRVAPIVRYAHWRAPS